MAATQLALSPDTLKKRLRAARAGNASPAQHIDAKDLDLKRLRHADFRAHLDERPRHGKFGTGGNYFCVSLHRVE